jgi:hypothetical protein
MLVNITGIENGFENNLVELYPNPTRDHLYLQTKDHQVIESIAVWDTFGNLLQKDENINSRDWHYDMLQHGPGVYIFRILANGQQQYAKIIRN